MTRPLPSSAAKHDAIYKQNRPPTLSCVYACERFCIRSGQPKHEGNEILRTEPDLAAVVALVGWIKHPSSGELLEKELPGSNRRFAKHRMAIQKTGGLQQQRIISEAVAAQRQLLAPAMFYREKTEHLICDWHAFGGFLVLL